MVIVQTWKHIFQLPWWGVLVCMLLNLFFTLPIGVIAATTNRVCTQQHPLLTSHHSFITQVISQSLQVIPVWGSFQIAIYINIFTIVCNLHCKIWHPFQLVWLCLCPVQWQYDLEQLAIIPMIFSNGQYTNIFTIVCSFRNNICCAFLGHFTMFMPNRKQCLDWENHTLH